MTLKKTVNPQRFAGRVDFKKSVTMHASASITGSLNITGALYLNGVEVSSGGSSDHEHTYAAREHSHSYAASSHNHDSSYAAASHNHDSSYAAASHNHDSSYLGKTSIPEKYEWISNHNFIDSGIAKTYIPWNSTGDQTTSDFWHRWIAPANGKLKKAYVMADGRDAGGGTNPGTTVFAFHIGGDIDTDQPTQIAGVTASITRDTVQTFDFGETAGFNAADYISLSIDPTAALQGCTVTCLWELSGSS